MVVHLARLSRLVVCISSSDTPPIPCGGAGGAGGGFRKDSGKS